MTEPRYRQKPPAWATKGPLPEEPPFLGIIPEDAPPITEDRPMADTTDEDDLTGYLQGHPYRGPFKPVPRYSAVGDMLEVHFEDAPAFAKQLNGRVTLLLALDDRTRVVGVKVFGVRELVEGAING